MPKKKGGLGKSMDAIIFENTEESTDGAVTVKLNEIEPNRDQPRKEFDSEALSELADSIAQHGVLQPLLLRPMFTGGYRIVAGERRPYGRAKRSPRRHTGNDRRRRNALRAH